MEIDLLVGQVIPPSDYIHRNGFSNEAIIDALPELDKLLLETALIQRLIGEGTKQVDTLIVDTLSYMKSLASLTVLNNFLLVAQDPQTRLSIAAAIFVISTNAKMIDIAIDAVRNMDDKRDAYYSYKLNLGFYYLAKFKTEKVVSFLEEYAKRTDYSISYNAKEALMRMRRA